MGFHDIAKSRSEIDSMVETSGAVFLEWRILTPLLHSDSGAPSDVSVAAEEPSPRSHVAASGAFPLAFITWEVVKYLRKQYVFYAGGRARAPVCLWGNPPRTRRSSPTECRVLLN